MPAPGLRARPIRKGAVPWLHLEEAVVQADEGKGAELRRGVLRQLSSRGRGLSTGCFSTAASRAERLGWEGVEVSATEVYRIGGFVSTGAARQMAVSPLPRCSIAIQTMPGPYFFGPVRKT